MDGYSEEKLISMSEGGDPSELKRFPSWTSEVYGFGKYIRKYAFYPVALPLFISTDHGPTQHDVPNQMDLSTPMPIHFFHSPRMVRSWKAVSEKPCSVLYSPFVFYRRSRNITLSPSAKGTIVFPTHSTHHIDTSADWDTYIKQLRDLPERFQPVSACLYFLDIQKGLHKVFLNRGVPVYTAGHWLDRNFIENFYDIIRQFKYATSNSVGSYLFYCVEMGLPFFLYGLRATKHNRGDLNTIQGTYTNVSYVQTRKIESLFSHISDHITEEQRRAVLTELGITEGTPRIKMSLLLYRSLFTHLMIKISRKLKNLVEIKT